MGSMRYTGLLTLVIIALGAPVVTAHAQAPPASDPGAGSPSGTIYQLPLDTARRDAAPAGSGGGGSDGAGGGGVSTPGSAIRSENGFGSSAVVPGQAAATGAGGSAGQRPATVEKPGRNSSRAATDGPRSSSGPAALVDSGPSPTVAIALLVAIFLVGGGIGVGATRRQRRG